MNTTFPEQNTFAWEEKPRWALWRIIDMFRKQSLAGKNIPRRMAYDAVVKALEDAEHQHGIETISSVKLKQLLVAAAQEHEWYPINRKRLAQAPDPVVPVGFKYCRKCKQVKEKDSFMAPATPAKAKLYGWKEDTTQKYLHNLCAPCRHANARKKKGSARYKLRHKLSELQLRTNPALNKRVIRYQSLHAHLAAHATKVRAAYSNVKVTFETPEGTYHEYQFRTDELRQFYESKKVLVNAARDRLEDLMGETAPLPDTWGMLLTRDEQVELSNLHAAAVQSSPANRKPVLWTLTLKDKEIKDNEEAQE